MRSPEQVQWDFVQQWLRKAKHDLSSASVLLGSDIESFESIGFHAQQAVEKLIKAVLVRHQVEFPKTHDIAQLRNIALKVEPDLSRKLEQAEALTPYGVEFRYPGEFPDLTREQAQSALQIAQQTKQLIEVHLKPYLDTGRPTNFGAPDGKTTKE